MKKDIKLIALDLYVALLGEDTEILTENKETLQKLQER